MESVTGSWVVVVQPALVRVETGTLTINHGVSVDSAVRRRITAKSNASSGEHITCVSN